MKQNVLLVFLCGIILGVQCDHHTCTPSNGDSPIMRSFGHHCFEFVFSENVTWNSAQQSCKYKGGSLVTITDDKLMEFLANELDSNPELGQTGVWIGLKINNQAGGWQWINGDSSNYENWAPEWPKDSSAQCAYMSAENGTWQWVSESCKFLYSRSKLNYICEYGQNILYKTCPYEMKKLGRYSIHFNNHDYNFDVGRTVQATDAEKVCSSRNQELATVPNQVTQICLHEAMQMIGFGGSGVWIGLSDSQKEGVWKWDNGEVFTYHNWANGEPGSLLGSNEDCVIMSKDGTWKDYGCTSGFLFSSNRFNYVCQKTTGKSATPPPPPTTTTTTAPTTEPTTAFTTPTEGTMTTVTTTTTAPVAMTTGDTFSAS